MNDEFTNTSILLANSRSLDDIASQDDEPKNKYGLTLSETQKAARVQGYNESTLGVQRSDWDEAQKAKRFSPTVKRAYSQTSYTDDETSDIDGESTTSDSPFDSELASKVNTNEMYKELYGSTAYAELKHRVGLQKDESFTEYYNRTHHIPRGFEKEAQLLLAEEERMEWYKKYQEGELSETDFLYNAYGKDLLKEQGYDLESPLYWYNQHKKGNYSNPLDNDLFLEQLISDCRSLWQADGWYKERYEKTLSSSLAGVVTGTQLSNEKVYELFKDQFDVLDEHFDNDINKIITYYQAGSIGMNVFNPFIDIDDDGTMDYYYHMDGKMYACKDSSGTGSSMCEVEYTTDASGKKIIHSVDVTENFPDWLEGLGTGLRNFVIGFADIGYLAYNAVASIFSKDGYGEGFVNNQQDYEAWKARNYLGGKSEIIMDGSNEWTAYNVTSAIGEIAGTILMTVATMGAGAAATGAKTAGSAAAKVAVSSIDDVVRAGVSTIDDLARVGLNSIDDIVKLGANSVDDLARIGINSVDDLTRLGVNSVDDLAVKGIKVTANSLDDVVTQIGSSTKKVVSKSVKGLNTVLTDDIAGMHGKDVIKLLQRSGMDDAAIKEFLKTKTLKTANGIYKLGRGAGLKNALAYGTGQVTGKILDISKGVLGTLSRAKTGQGFGVGMWTQALTSSAILAVQDFSSVYANLSAANNSLSYLSTIDPSIKTLSEEDIFLRAGTTAAVDIAISSLFRLTGSDGLTTKIKSLTGKNVAAQAAGSIRAGLNPAAQSSISNLSKHLVRNAIIDNVADAAENIITAAVSIAANNAYEDFNFSNILKGAGTYLTSPSGAMMTTYITAKNFFSAPKWSGKVGQTLWGKSTVDSRQDAILESYSNAARKMDDYMYRLSMEAVSLKATGIEENVSRATAIENLVNEYTRQTTDPSKNTVASIINFIQDYDSKVIGQDADTETIISMLGFKDIKDDMGVVVKTAEAQAKEIQTILKTFGKQMPEMGPFAAWVLNDAKVKNVEEIFNAYEETLNNAHKISKNITDVYSRILKGTYNPDDLLESSWLKQHDVKKFKDALDDLGKRMGYSHTISAVNMLKLFHSHRTIPLETNVKEFENTFDSMFDMEIFSKESLFQGITFKRNADGSFTIDKRLKKNKEGLSTLTQHSNPIVQMFAHLEIPQNRKALQTLINQGIFQIDANGKLIINKASQTPILGILVVKPEMMNTIKDIETAEGKMYAMYESIAALGEAVDGNGVPIADWETPLVTKLEIKNPDVTNGSGNDTTHRVFLIGNKLDASLIKFFNKPQMLNTMITSLHLLNSASDIDTIRKAALNFTLALSDVDETDLRSMTQEEQAEEFKKYLPQFASAILTMSNVADSNKTKSNLFNRERLLYLYMNGVITDEVLDAFVTNKITFGVSEKAKTEAKFLQDYIKGHNDVVDINKVFLKIKKVIEAGEEVRLDNSDFNKLKKLLINLKKPENKLILEALKEDKVINDNLGKLIEDSGTQFPFFEGLEVLGQALVDLTSKGISSIPKDAKALKEFIISVLDRASLEKFEATYNPVYSGMKHSLLETLSETQRAGQKINKEKKSLYDSTQAIQDSINILKNKKASLETKKAEAIKIILEWNSHNQPDDVWDAMSPEERNAIKAYHEQNRSEHKRAKETVTDTLPAQKALLREEIQKLYSNKASVASLIKAMKEANPTLSIELFAAHTLKTLLFTMDEVTTRQFFKDPEAFIEDYRSLLSSELVYSGSELDTFISAMKAQVNSKNLMNAQFDLLKPELTDNILRTYLRIASGETNKFLSGKIYKDSNGDWYYEEGTVKYSIADKLLSSNVTTAELSKAFNIDDTAQKISEIILNHNKFLSEDTITKAAENVIEINLIDFIPAEYVKLLKLYQTSLDAKANHSLQLQEEKLKREMSGILNGPELNYQAKQYLKLVQAANLAGSFIVKIPLDNKQQVEEWKSTFIRLGYGNEFMKLVSNENVNIPGVLLKTGTVSSIETGVSFNVFKTILKEGLNKLESHSSTGLIPKDNKTKLLNMFNAITYVTEDTEITIDEKQVFYGIPRRGEITLDTSGQSLIERFVKLGLVGGEFAKVFTILNRAMVQTEEISPEATNSHRALQIVNALASYAVGEFKQQTYEIQMTKTEYNKAIKFYEANPDSLFIIAGRKGDNTIFTLNEKLMIKDKSDPTKTVVNIDAILDMYTDKFDIRTLIPIWGKWETKHSYAEYQTVFDIVQGLGYSVKDLKEMSKKPLDILNISSKAKNISTSGKYVGTNSIKKISDEINWNTKNYYLLTKKAYLESALAYSKKFQESIQEDPRMESIIKFANRKGLVVLGNLLNKADFENIDVNNVDDMNKLLEAFKAGYEQPLEAYIKSDKIDYYTDEITSADISRLTPGRESTDVTVEDLKNMIGLLRSHSNLLVNTESSTGLPKHNSAWAVMSCIDYDGNGQAYISMEYFETLSKADRKFLLDSIKEAKDKENLDTPVKRALEKLHKTLEEKNEYLRTEELASTATTIKFDTEFPNSPTVELTKTIFGGLGKESQEALVTILANRNNTKLPPKRYISSSSIDNNTTYNPLIDSYMKIINETLYHTTDKQGHTMVYNLNCKEAIGEFFGSIAGFKSLLQSSDMFKDIDEQVLYDLAMRANAYSTGTTIDAEYSGALILTIKGVDSKGKPIYSIEPVEVSSGDPTKGIYRHLYETGGYTTDSSEKRIMITLNKNTFLKTPSGINSDIRAYDLNNEETRNALLQKSYYKALEARQRSGTYSPDLTPEEIIIDYYQPKTLTTSETFKIMINTLVDQGVNRNMAEAILPSIQKLNVANETSLGEEQLNTLMIKYIENPDIPNEEVKTLRDVLLFKVTHSNLPDDMKTELKNSMFYFMDNLNSPERAEIWKNVNLLLDDTIKDKKYIFDNLSKLSDEGKEIAFKLFILQRHSGQDLNFLMNRKNLFDYSNSIREKVGSTRNPYLDWYKDYKVITYDTEWLIYSSKHGKGRKDRGPLYQIGFTKTDPITDYTGITKDQQYTILIIEGLVEQKIKGQHGSSTDDGSNIDSLFYTEREDTFAKKREDAKRIGVGEHEGNVYVVKDLAEAIAKFEELTQGYTHFAGYNNKSEGSDNSWFGDFFERNGREVMDIRTDVNHKVLSSFTEPLAGDSLDYYGKIKDANGNPILKRTDSHDANSDTIDAIELFMKINNSTIDTEGSYNALLKDALDFCSKVGITDTETFLKNIVFDEVFSKSRLDNKELFDSVDIENSKYVIGNQALKESMSIYNSLLAKRYRRIRRKELETILDGYILGRSPSESRTNFIESIQDTNHRTSVLKVITKLFDASQVDLGNHTKALETYNKDVFVFLEKAIKIFQSDMEAANKGSHMSRADATEEFLASGIDTITDYLLRANMHIDPETGEIKPFCDQEILKAQLDIKNINKADISKLKKAWEEGGLSTAKEREFPNQTADLYAYHYFLEPINNLLGFKENVFDENNILGLDETTAKLFFNNIMHVYGATDDNLTKLQSDGFKIPAKKIDMFSKVDKELYNKAVESIFGKDFYSAQALYTMGSEKPEERIIADGASVEGYKAETGVVYIPESMIRKAFPDLNYKVGDEFFTQVWRQPGQHKTVMHVMKVKVTKKGSLSMTRTTAKSYFNGDFDGDFYYFAKPTAHDQSYGEAIDKYLRAHTSILDNLFNEISITEGTLDTTLSTVEKVTHKIMGELENEIVTLITKPDPKLLNTLKENFISKLIDEGVTKEQADGLWKDFGFRIINMSELSNENVNYVITNNPYIKTYKDIKKHEDLYYKLLNNTSDYLHANQYADYMDSQTVGGIAKNLNLSRLQGSPTDVLYTSRISLTADTNLRIQEALQLDGTKVYDNIEASLKNLKDLKILSTRDVEILTEVLGDKTTYISVSPDSASALFNRILTILSLTQDLVLTNKDYNNSIHSFIQNNLTDSTPEGMKALQEDAKHLQFLVDSANKFLGSSITLTPEDTSSRPVMLKKASEVINAMTTNQQRYYNRYFALSSSTLNNLFKDAVLKGDLEIDTVDKLEIISNKNKVFFDPNSNSIGTKTIKVAVIDSPVATDTAFITKNNTDTIDTMISIPDIKKLSNKQKDALFSLYSQGATISGQDLNSFLETDFFNTDVEYTFKGAQSAVGKPATSFEEVDQILVSTSTKLNNSSEYFKIGMTTGKAFKVTLGLGDVGFEDPSIGYIMSKNMVTNKFGPNTVINTKQTVKGSDGNTYTVYEISNVALIDTSFDKRVSNSTRKMDVISIMQGSQGLEAAISFGKWFLTLEGNDVVYDPEGYQALRHAIDTRNNPMGEETNGLSELNFIRIASIINSLSDESLLKFSAGVKGMAGLSKQEILSKLYQSADLGGDYGFDILNKLELMLSSNSKDMAAFIKLRDSNELLKRAWGTEVESRIEGTYRQTSQDFLSSSGEHLQEAYKSKHAMPKYNTRYSPMQNDMNIKNRLIAYEGSSIDYNNGYIGKFELLNLLMPESHFSKTKLDNLYNCGIIDFVKGTKGNLYNGFKFIEEGQGMRINQSDIPSLLPDKKVGTETPVASLKNMSTGTVTGLVGNSKGARAHSINEEALGRIQKPTGSTLTPVLQTRLAMLMGDGSKESLYNAFFPNEVTVGYSSSRPYLGIDDETIALKTASVSNANLNLMTNPEPGSALGIRDKIIEDTKAPIAAIHVQELNKSRETMIMNTKNTLDFIESEFKKENYDEKFKALIKLYEETSPTKLNANENFWESLRLEMLENEEETIMNLVKIYSNSNDIDLVNSILRSWGFKAKGNKDISLGNKIISLQNYVEGYKGQYLGREFDIIASILKNNKGLNQAFNHYMELSRRLDMYNELTSNGNKWEKTFGKKKYQEYVKQAEAQLLEGFSSKEEVEAKLKSLLASSATMNTLVNAAYKINSRLQEEARKINPYTILGYSIPVYSKDSKVKNDSWFKGLLVRNNTSYSSQEAQLLSGGETRRGDNTIQMVHLYDADCDGWTAMIQRISTDIALENSMKSLKDTLVSEGWMRNSDLLFAANSFLSDNIKILVNTLSTSKPRDVDVETYNILRASLNEAGISTERYSGASSFITLYNQVTDAVNNMYSTVSKAYNKNITNIQELYELSDANRESPNFIELSSNLKLANAHQQIMATMCSMISETKEGKNFLVKLYNHCHGLVNNSDYTLVDDRGASLNSKFSIYKSVDLEGYTRYLKYGNEDMSDEERKIAIAQMMLTGEVYLMKNSVAQQLQQKVFTKKIDGKAVRILKKASQLVTSFIMSTPIKLIDRIFNYTIYDMGVLGSADAASLTYVPVSTATIRRYMSSIDSISEYDLQNDKNLQYLIRYIAASGQSPVDANVFRGEALDPSNLPLIKSYLKKVNSAFNQQNLVARFAYFLDLVHSAEKNGGEIVATKAGVAYHMMDEIYKIKGNAKASDAYDNESKHWADVDAQAAQIIAENLGAVGNNPYGATALGRMGFMFTTFPLIGARWAKNRLQSLAYAFTHLGDGGTSAAYLGRNLGSLVLTNALLLAFQVMLSGDSQEYLFGDKEDMDEEEIKNAENIIFRGGCIKLFESIIQGEEVTTSAHNRGTEYALYDSFLKDLLEKEEDETFLDGLGKLFKTQVWSHLPALVKDPIESIPGNTTFQSTTWATPSDSFWDNYVRKISGYLMGSAQANAFIDSLEATEYEKDMSTYDRLALGMQKAYTDSSSNIKEYKSAYKNYKKAFSIIYEYNSILKGDDWASADYYPKDAIYTDFKSELNNALKNKNSSAAVYELIAKYKSEGTSLSTILSALKNSSLKARLSKLDDLDAFMDYLSDSEKATIKSALAYEDYNYPYLDNIIEELTDEYNKLKKSNYKFYPSIPKVYNNYSYSNDYGYNKYGNRNYYSYDKTSQYYNYLKNNSYNKSYNYTKSPDDIYQQFMNTWKYGKSTDIWGNRQTGYTNIKGDTWTWDGGK